MASLRSLLTFSVRLKAVSLHKIKEHGRIYRCACHVKNGYKEVLIIKWELL